MRKIILFLAISIISNATFAADSPQAIITIQSGELSGNVPFSLNLDGSTSLAPPDEKLQFEWHYPDGKIVNSKNPRSHRFTKAGKYEISLTITSTSGLSDSTTIEVNALTGPKKSKKSNATSNFSAQISDKITLSEIMPNPKGTDSKNEWIELFNSGETAVNLGNWKIFNGTKTFSLPDTIIIKGKGYLIIEKTQLKAAIKNSHGLIQLFDPHNKIIDEINYASAPEGLSYSKINENTWIWTTPTKNSKNQNFQEVSGKIISEFLNKNFQVIDTNNQTITIEVDENFNTQLFRTLLRKEANGTFLIQTNNKSLQNFKLNNEHNANAALPPSWHKNLYVALLILSITSLWLSWSCKSSVKHLPWSIPIRH